MSDKFTPRVLRNDRSNATITTTMSDREAFERYLDAYGDSDHWLLFWLHKTVEGLPSRDADQCLDYVCDWFLFAVGRGLKRPMIRVHFKNQRFKLYLSKRGTLCLKTGNLVEGQDWNGDEDDDAEPTSFDPTGNERYLGCFLRGVFRPARERVATQGEAPEYQRYRGRRYGRYSAPTTYTDGPEVKLNAVETEFLARLKEDPVKFLAECGRDMDRCCYCGLPLEDVRSKEAGYGPVCAGRWGLPWGGKGSGDDAVKTFGEVYSPECHFFAAACRAKIDDQLAWDMWSDWLTEQGAVREKKNRKGEVVRGFERPTGRFLYPRWDGPTPRRPERKIAPEPAPVALPAPVRETPPGVDPNDVPSGRLQWAASSKLLRGTISGLGWESIPGTIVVRSEKTGNTRTFRESCRDVVRGEVKAIHYRSQDGIKLVIANE